MLKLSHSGLSKYQGCPRKYRIEYVDLRLTIKVALALSFGRLLHKALDPWWAGEGLIGAVAALAEHSGDMAASEAARIAAMLQHYTPPVGDFHTDATEQAFEVMIRCPDTGKRLKNVRYRGVLDAIVRDNQGRRGVIEHKSTAQEIIGFGPYWQRLSIDHQHAWYRLAMDLDFCYYDVLRKPGQKLCGKDAPAKGQEPSVDLFQERLEGIIAASPEEWYQFRPVHLTDDDLHSAARDLYQLGWQVRDAHRRGWWPRNPDHCRTLYGTCSYLDVCTGQARLDDDTLFRDKT